MTGQSAPFLEIRDLHYTWPGGVQALRGLDLTLGEGERLGLVGPNGAGKSTTMLSLLGFLRPDQGEITLGGLPVIPRNYKQTRSMVGALFQDPDDQLFMPTLEEDVAFGLLNRGLDREQARARSRQALAEVGLEGMGSRPPHQLSGGEKRRAALATVLAMEPRLLLLDEPGANLDPRARRRLIQLLDESRLSQLLITHDLEMVLDLCPRSALMDGGQIVTQGPSLELLADEDLMERHGLEVPYSLRRDHLHRLGFGDQHHADHHRRGQPHRHD